MLRDDLKELAERYVRVEGEIKLLQEDKKQLLAEFKDKLDVKAFLAALRIARIKSKLNDTSEAELESILGELEGMLSIEHVE